MLRSANRWLPDMPITEVKAAAPGAFCRPAGGTWCACHNCEMARRQKEVRDLIVRMEESPSLGGATRRIGVELRGLVFGVLACIGGAALWVARRSEDDEWDPY